MSDKPAAFTKQSVPTRDTNSSLLILFVVGMCCLGNFLGPKFFWDSNYSYFNELLAAFAFGCLSAELSLLAIWLAMGVWGRFKRGLVIGMTTALLIFCYWVGMKDLEETIPLEFGIVLFICSTLSLLLFQLPLLIFKTHSNKKIIHDSEVKTKSERNQQFQIKHLLSLTAFAAVLLTLGKFTLGGRLEARGVPWIEVGGFLLTFIIYTAILILPCLLFVFNENKRWQAFFWICTVVVLVGPIFVFVGLSITFGPRTPEPEEFLGGTISFGFGNTIVTVFVLSIFKLRGYHLAEPCTIDKLS